MARRLKSDTKFAEVYYNSWDKGKDSYLSPTEIDGRSLVEAQDVYFEGDDLVKIRKRPGTGYFGDSQDSRVQGGIQFLTSSINKIIRASGDSIQSLDPDTGAISDLTGMTPTSSLDTFFTQLRGKLYIANGTEPLSYTDNATSITTFTELSTPSFDGSTPLARGAGLSSGAYTLSYRVTAVNDGGETLAATASIITVDIHPDEWDAANEYITVKWDRETDASCVGYKVYGRFGSADNGVGETYLSFIQQIDSGASVTWNDTGSTDYPASLSETVPLANTTGGQAFDIIFANKSDGRLYGVDWDTDPSQLWFSAGGELPHSFLITDGGGWIKYGTGDGDKIVAVTTLNENIIVAKQRRIGKLSITSLNGVAVPVITNINDHIGFAGPRAFVNVSNDIVYLSSDKKIRVLGNEANYFDNIRTAEIARNVKTDLDSINAAQLLRASAFYHEGYVGISFASGSSTLNDKTLIVDVERKGGIAEWTIGAFSFFKFIDSSYNTRLMACSEDTGYIEEWFLTTKSDKGVAYESRVKFKLDNMKLPYQTKSFLEIAMRVRRVTGALDINFYIDDEVTSFESLQLATTKDTGGFGSPYYTFGTMSLGTYGSSTTETSQDIEKRIFIGNPEGNFLGLELVHNSIGDFVVIDYGIVAEVYGVDFNPGENLFK